jgi:LAO/AO transport system kinase
MWTEYLQRIDQGDFKTLARCISLIENEVPGYEDMLEKLPITHTPIIGITGPPGAGKSTLTDTLIKEIIKEEKKVGVLCVDPSSPFNLGALLGDRIRMSNWYNNPNVFIRSLATRGSLGGLHPKTIELSDLLKLLILIISLLKPLALGKAKLKLRA